MDVSDRADDRPIERHPHYIEWGVSAVRVLGIRRIRERSLLAAAAAAVEYGVVLASADVQPNGDHRLDGSRERRPGWDEIDVPHETHASGDRALVVDHLVKRPAIARLVR